MILRFIHLTKYFKNALAKDDEYISNYNTHTPILIIISNESQLMFIKYNYIDILDREYQWCTNVTTPQTPIQIINRTCHHLKLVELKIKTGRNMMTIGKRKIVVLVM